MGDVDAIGALVVEAGALDEQLDALLMQPPLFGHADEQVLGGDRRQGPRLGARALLSVVHFTAVLVATKRFVTMSEVLVTTHGDILCVMDAYVTLPLGDDSGGYGHEPSAPPAPAPPVFLPRPPATAPIGAPESQGAPKFEVHVCEPTKSGNGYNAFVAYKVVCRTSMETYMSNDIAVNRRFNHFVWLHVQLSEQYPCYFIPVLPDKSGIDPYFNRFDAEFIERRRWALQMFLVRVVSHPVLMASKVLQIFFEGDENQMKLPEDKKPSLLGGFFKSSPSAPPKAVQDPEFLAMGQYIKDFEGQLFEVHKFMERLVMRRKDLGNSLGTNSQKSSSIIVTLIVNILGF